MLGQYLPHRIILVLILVISTALPHEGRAQDYTVGEHVKHTFTDAFDKTGLFILAIGSAATAFAFSQDIATHDSWKNNQHISKDITVYGDFWGTGIPEGAIALGQIVFDQERGIMHTEGLLMATGVTQATKLATQRQRPDSPSANSFPSGHTSASFATATSLTYAYGWWIGAPFYGLAIFTGLTRLSDNAHWLSDVVAGATVGILFGRSSFKHHFTVMPMVIDDGGNGGGIVLKIRI